MARLNRSAYSSAQSRALTRLSGEERTRFRRLYADAPDHLSASSRRAWAKTQLSLECSDRYRALYAEEMAALPTGEQRSVDPDVVGKASGPGPLHAVIASGSMTLCGRTRFHTYPKSASWQVTCTYCIDELREKRVRPVDPHFRQHAATAEARLHELAVLRTRVEAAERAAFESLATLQTPPRGTPERVHLAELLGNALGVGMTLRDIGKRMNLSGERVRQIVAESGGEATDG